MLSDKARGSLIACQNYNLFFEVLYLKSATNRETPRF